MLNKQLCILVNLVVLIIPEEIVEIRFVAKEGRQTSSAHVCAIRSRGEPPTLGTLSAPRREHGIAENRIEDVAASIAIGAMVEPIIVKEVSGSASLQGS